MYKFFSSPVPPRLPPKGAVTSTHLRSFGAVPLVPIQDLSPDTVQAWKSTLAEHAESGSHPQALINYRNKVLESVHSPEKKNELRAAFDRIIVSNYSCPSDDPLSYFKELAATNLLPPKDLLLFIDALYARALAKSDGTATQLRKDLAAILMEGATFSPDLITVLGDMEILKPAPVEHSNSGEGTTFGLTPGEAQYLMKQFNFKERFNFGEMTLEQQQACKVVFKRCLVRDFLAVTDYKSSIAPSDLSSKHKTSKTIRNEEFFTIAVELYLSRLKTKDDISRVLDILLHSSDKMPPSVLSTDLKGQFSEFETISDRFDAISMRLVESFRDPKIEKRAAASKRRMVSRERISSRSSGSVSLPPSPPESGVDSSNSSGNVSRFSSKPPSPIPPILRSPSKFPTLGFALLPPISPHDEVSDA